MKTVEIHVYPIPAGMSADEAWAELTVFGYFPEYRWWNPRFRWPFVKWTWCEVEVEDELRT